MRRIVALLAVAVLLGTAGVAHAQTAGGFVSGSGIGTDNCFPIVSPATCETFEFTAQSGPDGEDATGTFAYQPANKTASFTGVVICLAVLEDGRANIVMDGTYIPPSSFLDRTPQPSWGIAFVDDNGTPGAGLDGFSFQVSAKAQFPQPPACDLPRNPPPILAGEIVVTPFGAAPTAVVLTPPTAVNSVGTSHTVTATVTTATGAPSAGYTVYFTVSGSVTTAGSCTTDSSGRCSFTYSGPTFPGADLITGCVDSDSSGAADPGEPCGEATKIWVLPVTTPGQVTGGGWVTRGSGSVSFGFNAQSDGEAIMGNCNVIDHTTKSHIKCETVETLVVTPTHATFFGRATVDGVTTDYRIDVDDLGEPGTLDTFKIQTDSGYVAAGTLQGGDIQIHP